VIFERFEDKGLSQYSYLIGCERAGLAAVVDPRRDVDEYVEFASTRGVRISHVLETHIHADFASGARELAERTGATLALSAYDEGQDYEYAFNHRPIADGDEIAIGVVRLVALHTPGHTPEHLSFLVFDEARAPRTPMALLSGDFLFVGSVGRPDLLGEKATVALAGQMYDAIGHALAGLPDGLEVAPGHGAGSMCGAGMSGRASSTLGFERIANPYLNAPLSREAFVSRLLDSVPPFPPYYRRMKQLNAEGPPILGGLPGLTPLSVSTVRDLLETGAVIVDLRDQIAFGHGHIPESFGIGARGNVSTWASWVVPYDRTIVLVPSEHEDDVELAVRGLVRVGLDRIAGYLDGGVESWTDAGHALAATPQLAPAALARQLSDGTSWRVLDVRSDEEWRTGHLNGATHIVLSELADRTGEIAQDGAPIVVLCGTGYRSTVAASLLEREGVSGVHNVTGGMAAWREAGLAETQV
jgi:hydroxyacylglutathione hydrolase